MIQDWLVWASLTLSAAALVYRALFGFPKFKRQPKQPRVQEDPWATWKKYALEHRLNVEAAHKQWEDEAWEILRRHCEQHVYHHQKWYTCMLCGYEEPWEWKHECKCRVELVSKKGIVQGPNLIERQSFCKVHGRDFNSWPVSLRDTPGNYGSDHRPLGDRTAVEKGMALQRTMSRKRVRFMEDIK